MDQQPYMFPEHLAVGSFRCLLSFCYCLWQFSSIAGESADRNAKIPLRNREGFFYFVLPFSSLSPRKASAMVMLSHRQPSMLLPCAKRKIAETAQNAAARKNSRARLFFMETSPLQKSSLVHTGELFVLISRYFFCGRDLYGGGGHDRSAHGGDAPQRGRSPALRRPNQSAHHGGTGSVCPYRQSPAP